MSHLHTVEPTRFRDAMRTLAGGVTIIATRCSGVRHGLTATAVCSLSTAPPSLIVCVNRDVSAHEAICESRMLSVNILSVGQKSIAQIFSGEQGKHGEEKFTDLPWATTASGVPILDGCLASLECSVVQVSECNTHSILICLVHDVTLGRGEPILYWSGDYRSLQLTLPLSKQALINAWPNTLPSTPAVA